MLKRLKKNGNKGFTLVELIVVLVILAILAALLVPALTGYIDKARDKQVIAETRQAVMAAQTLADEYYTTQNAGTKVTFVGDATSTATDGKISLRSVEKLAELKANTINEATVDAIALEDDLVTGSKVYSTPVVLLNYENHGKKCQYTYSTANGAKYTIITGDSFPTPSTPTTTPTT